MDNKLGRELKISPKAAILHNSAGFASTYYMPTVQVIIGIGNNHTAELIMGKEDWIQFIQGAEVHIEKAEIETPAKSGRSKHEFKNSREDFDEWVSDIPKTPMYCRESGEVITEKDFTDPNDGQIIHYVDGTIKVRIGGDLIKAILK